MKNKYGYNDWILKTWSDYRFKNEMEIQAKTWPLLLKKENIIGISSTGSGKTLAFLMPILQNIELNKNIQVVILTPTRELARQIFNEITKFKKNQILLKHALLIGGKEIGKQIENINRLNPQIIVATVDRFNFVIENKKINYSHLKTIVLDEMDMLIDLGFSDNIANIITKIEEKTSLQKSVWSATINEMLSFQIAKFLTNSKIIKIGNSIYENNNIEHKIIHNINPDETLKFLVKEINPFFCIIFANTKKEVEYIYKMLLDIDNKLNATFVHAGLVERERKNKIKEVKDLKYQYLIATDLVSRGLDINGASHVINYNLPDDPEWYVHRSGRCGRGKYTGTSYIIYNEKEDSKLINLESKKITFNHFVFKKDAMKAIQYKNKTKTVLLDEKSNNSIRKIINDKAKVKPGYKKKKAEEIKKIKQKSKRKHIENKMNEIRKKSYIK